MWRPSLTITLFTFVEVIRSRFFSVLAVSALLSLSLGFFLGQIAITETREIQASLLAGLLRLLTVFLLGAVVIASVIRERNDKGMDFLFAMPLTRADYYFGKFAGFALVNLLVTIVFAAILLVYGPPVGVLLWALSLFCEALLIIALALLLSFSFRQIITALSGLFGIYLLARSIDGFILLAQSPYLDQTTGLNTSIEQILTVIAWLLPTLHLFTQSAWLIEPPDVIAGLGPVLLQTLLYGVLVSAAAIYDLYRKSV